MKKIIIILYILFPFVVFSQTQTENYIKTVEYQKAFVGQFNNFSQNITTNDLFINGSGGGSGTISISNNILNINFSGSLSASTNRLKEYAKGLIASPSIPDMELGPILTTPAFGSQPTGYNAKIVNNHLIFYSVYFIKGASINLSSNISTGSLSYSVSTGNIYTCPSGSGGGGSGTLNINNGIVTLTASGTWSDLCSLKTGQVVYLNTVSVPNTELGVIRTNTGLNSAYSAKIENNWLVFYPNQPIPPLPSSVSLNTTFNLGITSADKIETVTYIDGLGRNKQIVNVRRGGNQQDIVKHFSYDQHGRESKEFLPYAGSSTLNGAIYPNPIAGVYNFYNTLKYDYTINPYTEKRFETNDLNKVLETAAPGNSWQLSYSSETDHTEKYEYSTNLTTDKVKYYSVTPNTVNLVDNGYYLSNTLTKNIIKNENWKPGQQYVNDNTSIEFKDKLERIILRRHINAGKWHDTYYIYDEFGNLTLVLPPQLNTYPNEQQIWETQSYPFDDVTSFYPPGVNLGDDNEGSVYLSGSYLYIYFDNYGQGPNSPLNITTPVIDLNFNPPLPDMQLGNVTIKLANGTYSDQHYTAYSLNGDIYLSGDGTPAYGVYIENDLDMSTITSNLGIVINTTELDRWAYQYKYDERNRLIEQKLPGKDWEYIIYDNLDRKILTQDKNLRLQNKWLFLKYDTFGRVIYSGLWTNPIANQSRTQVQALVNQQVNPVWSETKQTTPLTVGSSSLPAIIYYTNSTFPKVSSEIQILEVYYFDNYQFDISGFSSETAYGLTPITTAKKLVTGSKIRIPDTNHWKTTVNYYDKKQNKIFMKSLDAYSNISNSVKVKYNFSGKILESELVHSRSGNNTIVVDKYAYNHAGDLLTHKQKINQQAEQLLQKNTYDELGKVILKQVGNNEVNPLQNIDYTYNVRGWLKGYNDVGRTNTDLFSYNINYDIANTPYNYNDAPGYALYNGNISSLNWKTDNTSSELRSYYYKYDKLGRFNDAQYGENDVLNSKFSERVGSYDRNGNIKDIVRYSQDATNPSAPVLIDNLQYKYDGNRLTTVTDLLGLSAAGAQGFKDNNNVGVDYTYDNNGNLTSDKNKGITNIIYNYQNLPIKVVFNNSDVDSPSPKVILYTYDANGTKIEKIVKQPKVINGVQQNTTTTTLYTDKFIYENGVMQYFSNPEGYASNNSDTFKYVFQHRDHLDNIRLSYSDIDNNGIITGASTEIFYDGFEAGTGWESTGAMYGGAVTYDSTRKHSGNASGKIEKLTTGELYVQSNSWINVNNSQPTEYILSGWIYSNGPSADLYLFMNTADETGYNTANDFVRTVQTNRWVYIQKKITVQPQISKLAIRLDNNGGGIVWFDDINLRRVNPTNEIVEENNYYPFGLQHKKYNNAVQLGEANPIAQSFRYNNKELDEVLGLNLYDYGARNYDPAIGRWLNIDPLAEKSRRFSPYAYALDNPIFYVDPDGMQATPPDWVRSNGVWEYKAEITSRQQAEKAGYDGFAPNGSVVHAKGPDGTVNHYVLLNDGYGRAATPAEIAASKNPTPDTATPAPAPAATQATAEKPAESIVPEKVSQASSGVGLGNDVKSTILTAAGVVDDLGKYSTALKVIGGGTGIITMVDSGSKIYDAISKGQTPDVKDVISFVGGAVSLGTSFLKVSTPVGIVIGVVQIGWGIYTMLPEQGQGEGEGMEQDE